MISNIQELYQNLLLLLSPNGQTRMVGERAMQNLCTDSKCLMMFVEVLESGYDDQIRQLACVLMRVKIKTFWQDLKVEKKERIRSGLLKCLQKEKVVVVSRNLSRCVTEIAEIDIPQNEFPDLMTHLTDAKESDNRLHVLSALEIFSGLLEKVPQSLVQRIPLITGLIIRGLDDPDWYIRDGSVTTISSLFDAARLNNSPYLLIHVFEVIPPLRLLLENMIREHRNPDPVFALFEEIFSCDIESEEFEKTNLEIVKSMCEIATNSSLTEDIRIRGLDVVCQIVKGNSGTIAKSKEHLKLVMKAIVECMCFPESNEQINDDLSRSLFKTGCGTLDQLAVSMPSVYIFDDIVSHAERLFKERPNDVVATKCALSLIGVISEGCAGLTRKNLFKFVPMVIKYFRISKNPMVRKIAIMDLMNFAEYCQPEIVEKKFSDQILPVIVEGLEDKEQIVIQRSLLLIDGYFEEVGQEECAKVSKKVLQRLLDLCKVVDPRTDLRKNLISAIGTIGVNQKELFRPYFRTTMDMLQKTVDLTKHEPHQLASLRGMAFECVGLLAVAVGKEIFGPFAETFFDMVFSSVQQIQSDYDLNENSLNFINNMAVCLKNDFAPYFEKSFEYVFSILNLPDGHVVPREDHAGRFLVQPPLGPNNRTMEFGDLDASNFRLQVRSGLIEVKATAIQTLARIAEAMGKRFEGERYFEKSFNWVIKRFTFFTFSIQQACAKTFPCLIRAVFPPKEVKEALLSEDSKESKFLVRFRSAMEEFVDVALERIMEEADKETVATILDSFSKLINGYGVRIYEEKLEDVRAVVVALMNRDVECFMGETEEFEEMEEGDHDAVLTNSMLNFVDQVAKSLGGPKFGPIMEEIFPKLMFLAQRSDIDDQTSSIGTFAEITSGMKVHVSKYAKIFLPVVIKSLKHGLENRVSRLVRNSSFCLGIVAEHASVVFVPHVRETLELLKEVLCLGTEEFRVVVLDNVCAALGRICVSEECFIKEEELEVLLGLFLENMPLEEDLEEIPAVFGWVCHLVEKKNPVGMKYVEKLVELMGWALEEDDKVVTEQVKSRIKKAMGTLMT